MKKHAKFSPSAASRWMNCPASIAYTADMPDKTSEFAQEGTEAHALVEAMLRGEWYHPDDYSEEMLDAADQYVEFVSSLPGELHVEERLDLTHIHNDFFGTGDALVYDEQAQHLYVCDFKYGKGVVVDVEENPQLMTYAVGATRRFHNRGVKTVTLAIIQPRAMGKSIKTWQTTAETILAFEEKLREAVKIALSDTAPFKAGEWCKFCKAAAICPSLREHNLNIARQEFDGTMKVTDMTPAQLAQVLDEVETIKLWLKRVEEYAHEQALAGNTPVGYKLVPKRAIRKWKDEAAVPSVLGMVYGLGRDEIYSEPKLKSPAMIEKAVGKKNAGALEDLVVKDSTGMVLAKDDDERPALRSKASEDFA